MTTGFFGAVAIGGLCALALCSVACGGGGTPAQEPEAQALPPAEEPAAPPAAEPAPPAEESASADAPAAAEAAPPAEPPDEQIAMGQKLYAANCAKCHGDKGQGGKAPPVVGKDALPLDPPPKAKFRKGQFKSAADVFEFVHANMPPKKGGSLSDEEYTAILAFALTANSVKLERKLDASLAQTIMLHQ